MNKFLPRLISKEFPLMGFQTGIKSSLRKASGFLSKNALKTFMIIGLGLSSVSAFAQTKQITGKVTDAKDGSAIFGATVTASGGATKQATQTSADGTFTLNAPVSSTKLTITYVGYDKQELTIGSKTNFSVSLVSNAQDLNAVVVTGYGGAKKKDLTGAVTSLTPRDFNQGTISTPSGLLQGKVAGLEVTASNGQPGAANLVQLRGNSSVFTGSDPLYVIDGIPLDGRSVRVGFSTPFGGSTGSDPLIYVNTNDIGQVDIQKDASSTAIYGSRGSNGVIQYTFKKATPGTTRVDANATFGITAGLMKKYDILSHDQFVSALGKYGVSGQNYGGNYDATKQIQAHGVSQSYNLAFSGGSDLGNFRASFLGSKQNGLLLKDYLEKYVGTLRGNYKFLDQKLTVDFSLIVANVNQSLAPIANNPGSQGNIISAALSWNPTRRFDSAGAYIIPANGSGNPIAFSDATSDIANSTNIVGSIAASYKILKNLEYKFVYGANHSVYGENYNVAGWLGGFNGISGQGYGAILNSVLNSQDITHTLDYKTNFGKINLEVLAGFDYYRTQLNANIVTGTGFNFNLNQANRVPILYTSVIQNANSQTPAQAFVEPVTEIQSEFARVNLSYASKYYLTGTIRADGSNKFGSNNNTGVFPSGAFKWVLKQEDFLKDSKFISNLELRASYGTTGNSSFSAGSAQSQFSYPSFNAANQSVVGNPDLKWEKTKQTDIGLNFSLLEGKIYGTFDYYHKNTSQTLTQEPVIQPGPSGVFYTNLNDNLINSGIELGIGVSIISKPNISWDINGNVAYNHNIIKNYINPLTGLPIQFITGTVDGQGVSGSLAQEITNNLPLDEWYLKHFSGFDAKGNQIVSANPSVAGDPNPHTIAGLGTTFRYKQLTAQLNFGAQFNYLIYNNTATNITNLAGISNGRNVDLNAYNSAESANDGVQVSDRFLESGNYVKLRNASLSYSVGNVGQYIKGLKVFVNGNNLFVITKYSGFDPEVNTNKSANSVPSRSLEYLPYPTPRTFSLGLGFSL